MEQSYRTMTVDALLARYPQGFAVSPSGALFVIEFASSHLAAIAQQHPVAPPSGGYYVVRAAEESTP